MARTRTSYRASSMPNGMKHWIVEAAAGLRIERGRLMVHVASQLNRRESTISRFEHHLNWPTDIDETVAAYARDLEMSPIEIWARALELWRAATPSAGAGPEAPSGELGRPPEAAPPSSESPEESERPPAAGAQ